MRRSTPVWSEKELNDYLERQGKRRSNLAVPPKVRRQGEARRHEPGTPNATEERFNREVLNGLGIYEGVTFRLPGKGRRPLYTPDWCLWDDAGRLRVYEVKGAFRFGSESRASCAFAVAAACFPEVAFNWAKWNGKAKRWEWKCGEPPRIEPRTR